MILRDGPKNPVIIADYARHASSPFDQYSTTMHENEVLLSRFFRLGGASRQFRQSKLKAMDWFSRNFLEGLVHGAGFLQAVAETGCANSFQSCETMAPKPELPYLGNCWLRGRPIESQ